MERRRFLSFGIEQKGVTGQIPIETGIHPLDSTHLYDALDKGDLTSHLWNSAVAKRIHSYGYNAPTLVLAIDGLSPYPKGSFGTDQNEPGRNAWVSLPARPKELNKSSTVYTIAGDSMHTNLQKAIGIFFGVDEVPKELIEQARQQDQDIERISVLNSLAYTAGQTLELSALLALQERLIRTDSDAMLREPHPVSRRKILKYAAQGAVALSPFLVKNLSYISGYSTNETAARAAQDIEGLYNKGNMRTWVDGRTALLYAKTAAIKDAGVSELNDAQFAVVMGVAHNDQAANLRTKEQRAQVILDYAKLMVDYGQQLYATFNHIAVDQVPDYVTNRILDYISKADVRKVTDPGGPDLQSDFPQKVGQYVTPVGTFTCQEILDVTQALRK